MYTLSPDAAELLQNNQVSFKNCYGNPLQQQIHKELITTLGNLVNVKKEYIELGNLYINDSDAFHTKTAQISKQCKQVIKQGIDYYKSLPPGAAVEETVATLCEFIIPGKILKIVYSLAKISTINASLNSVNKLRNLTNLSSQKYVKLLYKNPAGVLLTEAYDATTAKVNTLVNAARHAKKYVCKDAQHVKKHLFIPKHIQPFLPTNTENRYSSTEVQWHLQKLC